MAAFDPYHAWLEIPPQDQPPDHYRLLGVTPFEPDSSRILRAAKRRMVQVRARASADEGHLLNRILNEISAARACLLTSEKRAEYDRTLRERLQAAQSAAPPVSPPVASAAKSMPRMARKTFLPSPRQFFLLQEFSDARRHAGKFLRSSVESW